MTHLLFLIPLSIGMGLIGLGAFFWALRNDQFEDPEGDAWRVIAPQDPPPIKGTSDDRMAPHSHDRDTRRGL